LPGTRGALDFAHPAHPIVTPLVISRHSDGELRYIFPPQLTSASALTGTKIIAFYLNATCPCAKRHKTLIKIQVQN